MAWREPATEEARAAPSRAPHWPLALADALAADLRRYFSMPRSIVEEPDEHKRAKEVQSASVISYSSQPPAQARSARRVSSEPCLCFRY